MLDLFDKVRRVRAENGRWLYPLGRGRRKSFLGDNQELLADGAIVGVVVARVFGAQDVKGQ